MTPVLILALLGGVPFQARPGDSKAWRKGDVADTGRWTVGLEVDLLLSRELDDDSPTGSETDNTGTVTGSINPNVEATDLDFSSTFTYLRGAYSLYSPPGNRFGIEAYVMLGMADAQIDGDLTRPGNPTEDFDASGDTAFAMGAGLRSRLYRAEQFAFLADLSFRWSTHDTKLKKVSHLDLDLGAGETASQDFETTVLAWSLALTATYELRAGSTAIVPYAGFRFSSLDIDLDGDQSFFDPGFDKKQEVEVSTEAADLFGLVLGVEAAFTPNLSAFLELRLLDETAVTIGGGWAF